MKEGPKEWLYIAIFLVFCVFIVPNACSPDYSKPENDDYPKGSSRY